MSQRDLQYKVAGSCIAIYGIYALYTHVFPWMKDQYDCYCDKKNTLTRVDVQETEEEQRRVSEELLEIEREKERAKLQGGRKKKSQGVKKPTFSLPAPTSLGQVYKASSSSASPVSYSHPGAPLKTHQ